MCEEGGVVRGVKGGVGGRWCEDVAGIVWSCVCGVVCAYEVWEMQRYGVVGDDV
jgi:hypothetical protein